MTASQEPEHVKGKALCRPIQEELNDNPYSKQRFEHLFKDSYPHMYRMAFSMVEDADDAKDAVNQVFTQKWKGKPNVSEESVRGYLLAATRNQCLHILRQRQLQQMEEELRKTAEESSNEEREELLQELQQVIDDNLTGSSAI